MQTEVAVLGSGVQGALVCRELANAGVDHLLISGLEPGGVQTRICQGYLHRGFFYEDSGLINLLGVAVEEWARLESETSLDVCRGACYVGFDNAIEANHRATVWDEHGMDYKEAGPSCHPIKFPALSHMFQVDEAWIKDTSCLTSNLLVESTKIISGSARLLEKLTCPLKSSPELMRESQGDGRIQERQIDYGSNPTHPGTDHQQAPCDRGAHQFGDDAGAGRSQGRGLGADVLSLA